MDPNAATSFDSSVRKPRDLRAIAAHLLALASFFVLLNAVAWSVFLVTDEGTGGPPFEQLLAEGLKQLGGMSGLAGYLALASLLVAWFCVHASRDLSQVRRKWLIWPVATLGCVVGAAGIAGTALSSNSAPYDGNGWYLTQEIASSMGTTLLGVAVALCAMWSAREYLTPGPGA